MGLQFGRGAPYTGSDMSNGFSHLTTLLFGVALGMMLIALSAYGMPEIGQNGNWQNVLPWLVIVMVTSVAIAFRLIWLLRYHAQDASR